MDIYEMWLIIALMDTTKILKIILIIIIVRS